MNNSYLHLDVYPLILKHLNLETLCNFNKINKFCNKISKKELKKRLNSKIPFDSKNAKIELLINDIYLEKIFVLIENKKIEIPQDKYYFPFIRELLIDWFVFSFSTYKWILTFKIFKSIIRLNNKNINFERKFNDNEQILIFEFKKEKSYLINLI